MSSQSKITPNESERVTDADCANVASTARKHNVFSETVTEIDYSKEQEYMLALCRVEKLTDLVDPGDAMLMKDRAERNRDYLDCAYRALDERRESVKQIRLKCEGFIKFSIGIIIALLGIERLLIFEHWGQTLIFVVSVASIFISIVILMLTLKTQKLSGMPDILDLRGPFYDAPDYQENVARSIYLTIEGITVVQNYLALRVDRSIKFITIGLAGIAIVVCWLMIAREKPRKPWIQFQITSSVNQRCVDPLKAARVEAKV